MAPIPHNPSAPPDEEHDAGAAVWGFLWVLFAFKMATVVLIFWNLSTWETGVILGATTWYWFPTLGLLAAGPLLFRWRLRRVRARREALRRAEWMLGQEETAPGRDGPRP